MIEKTKNKSIENAEHKITDPLVCVADCFMPGVGAWKRDDVVSDQKIVERLRHSRYFKPQGGNK